MECPVEEEVFAVFSKDNQSPDSSDLHLKFVPGLIPCCEWFVPLFWTLICTVPKGCTAVSEDILCTDATWLLGVSEETKRTKTFCTILMRAENHQ